ncbi:MAG: hypothetical protein QOE66_3255, partial [Chloroflexota bacterium]|nr:hypothetical protein [Chloroflexota bacterium]
MLDLGFLLFLTIAAAGVGLRLLDRLGGRPESPADALALAVPLGLGMLALATLGLGELGVLNRTGLAVVLAVGTVLGTPWSLRAVHLRVAHGPDEIHPPNPPFGKGGAWSGPAVVPTPPLAKGGSGGVCPGSCVRNPSENRSRINTVEIVARHRHRGFVPPYDGGIPGGPSARRPLGLRPG